jgi:hypothetical protein
MKRVLAPALIALAAFGVAGTAEAQTPPAAPAAPASPSTPSTPSTPSSPAKKELVQRLMRLQQSDVEGFARTVVERPAAQMMQEAGMHIQRAIPADKREATGRAVEAEVKKYVDESYPIVRDRALKIAPTTIGSVLEAKMTEQELKALVAWLESPTYKKFQQLNGEMRNSFTQQLLAEAGPLVEPKLMALDGRIRTILGVPPAGAAAGPAAPPPARPASK